MFRVCLFLALMATLSAFQFMDFGKRSQLVAAPATPCPGRMEACFQNGQVQQFGANRQPSDLIRVATFRLFCEAVRVDARCDLDYVARCGSGMQSNVFDIISLNRDYYLNICNSNLSQILESEEDSACVTDPVRRRTLFGMLSGCQRGYESDILNRHSAQLGVRGRMYSFHGMELEFLRTEGCRFLHHMKSCAVNSATMMCGWEIGAAMETTIDSWIDAYKEQVHCQDSS